MQKNYRFRKNELFRNMDFLLSEHFYLDFPYSKFYKKTIYYNEIHEIKGILLQIILIEVASKWGNNGTGLGYHTK